MSALLQVNSISLSFGGLKAVSNFSLSLNKGDLQGLIGPNGAGKTTCFNLLTGVYAPHQGEILLEGKRLNGLRPHQITRRGMARTFQNIRLFGNLTVLDNVMVASQTQVHHGLFSTVLRTAKHRREERELRAHAMELLDTFGLAAEAGEQARNLPYGSQRRLEIARALATNPKILLLDEPAADMNPQEKKTLANLIRDIRDRFQLTVFLIEHDMTLALELVDHVLCLDNGVPLAYGTPDEIRANPAVQAVYLGRRD